MMDPLTCLSMVSNSVQLADFMFHLLHESWKIHRSGAECADSTKSIEGVTTRLMELNDKVVTAVHKRRSCETDSSDESCRRTDSSESVISTAKDCSATASRLIEVLEKLKTNKAGAWNSFRTALKTVMKKKEVEILCSAVFQLQCSLALHLQFELLESQSDLSNALRKLSKWSQSYQSDFGRAIQTATNSIRDYITSELTPLQEDMQRILTGQDVEQESVQVALDQLLAHIQPISEQLANLVPHTKTTMKDMEFLKELSFGEIRARRESIPKTHAQTFEWVFKNRTPDDLYTLHFVNWLEHGSGIYWVRGKPGSGKSTLMKFLPQHKKTRESLLKWSREEKLVISTHFFWNAGSALQKTQMGLFRTLLFDILLQLPEMIPDVEQLLDNTDDPYNPWSYDVLRSALKLVTAVDLPVRFCFFIDGLDEYEGSHGSHGQLVESIIDMASSRNIKICASSRPWACFLDAFGEDRRVSLRLEELTASDIRAFVDDKIGGNHHFQRYRQHGEYVILINEVVSRADGVFLWVVLVVKSLLEGLSYSDRISDLMRRLDSLPTDLESFFQHILGTVQGFYQHQSAQTFLFALNGSEALPTVFYSAMDLIDGDSARISEVSYDLTLYQVIQDSAEEVTRRLDGRSKGLLEVTNSSHYHKTQLHERFKVGFLHRTVRDWLRDRDFYMSLKVQAGPDFDVHLAVAQASAAMIRSLMRAYPAAMCQDGGIKLFEQLDQIISQLARIGPEAQKQGVVLLDGLAEILSTSVLRQPMWPNRFYTSGPDLLLQLAVEHRMLWYVKSRVEREPALSQQAQYQLLAYALNIGSSPLVAVSKTTCLDLVGFLLDGHADPNCQTTPMETLWTSFLDSAYNNAYIYYEEVPRLDSNLDHEQTVKLLGMLVSAGARISDVRPSTIKVIRMMLSPQELKQILGDQYSDDSAAKSSRASRVDGQTDERKTASSKKKTTRSSLGSSTRSHSRTLNRKSK